MAFRWVSWLNRKGKRTKPHIQDVGQAETLCRSLMPSFYTLEFGTFEGPFRNSIILGSCCPECVKAFNKKAGAKGKGVSHAGKAD